MQACHVWPASKKPRQVYLPPKSTYIYIYKSFCLPANKSSQDIHLPASDGSGPSNLASAQISSSTRGNFPDRHANDKGDNGKAWTKHWASTPLQVDCHFWGGLLGLRLSIHQQLVYSYLRGTTVTPEHWKIPYNSTKAASLLESMIVSTRVLPGVFDHVWFHLCDPPWHPLAKHLESEPSSDGTMEMHLLIHLGTLFRQHPDVHRLLIGARQSILRLVGTGCSVTLLRILPRKKKQSDL